LEFRDEAVGFGADEAAAVLPSRGPPLHRCDLTTCAFELIEQRLACSDVWLPEV
jgi:hypothetical protein